MYLPSRRAFGDLTTKVARRSQPSLSLPFFPTTHFELFEAATVFDVAFVKQAEFNPLSVATSTFTSSVVGIPTFISPVFRISYHT